MYWSQTESSKWSVEKHTTSAAPAPYPNSKNEFVHPKLHHEVAHAEATAKLGYLELAYSTEQAPVGPCYDAHSFSAGTALDDRKSCAPRRISRCPPRSADQVWTKPRGQGWRPTATHHHGYRKGIPQAAHGHCRARNAMAVTQRHHCRLSQPQIR